MNIELADIVEFMDLLRLTMHEQGLKKELSKKLSLISLNHS